MASLRANVENAFQSLLTAAGIAVPIYTGFDDEDKANPCVVVAARRAEEDPPFSGNYRVTVDYHVKGSPDSDGTFEALSDQVRAAIWTSTLHDDLAAQGSDLTVWGCTNPHTMEWTQSGGVWVESGTVEIYCASR
jgi:hypothetical protein